MARGRLLFILMAVAVASTLSFSSAQAARSCGPRGPLVAYGHSYLVSPKLGGAPVSYATLAARRLEIPVDVRAVNRSTSEDVNRFVHAASTAWRTGSSDVVLIDSAINDIGERVPTARWTAALRAMLSSLATTPAPAILLVRPLPVLASWHPGHDPSVIEAYARAQRRVAAEFPTVRIVNASAGWNPRLFLGPDGVHPTAAGMRHIAEAATVTARQVFCV